MARRSAHKGSHFATQPTHGRSQKAAATTRAKGGGVTVRPAANAGTTGFEQAATMRHNMPGKPRRSRGPVAFIVFLIVLALLGAGGIVFWRHRPVSITVNGVQRTVMRRSTYDDVFQQESLHTKPGNLVSVGGNLLKEGEGHPYTVMVNGQPVSFDEATTHLVWGGENLEYTDGDDALEPYTTTIEDLPPKLEFKVTEGTGERGYMVQQGTVQYVSQWGKAGRHEVRHGEQTGEVAPGDVIEDAQNVVVVAQNIHPDNDQKLVALTFDDGPTYYTEPYLSILDEYDAKATFCVIGEQLADGGPVTTQTSEAGHQVISHSWSHLQLTTLDEEELHHQIADTAATIQECIGYDPRFIRPPYGDIDEQVWLKSKGDMSASVFWTHDSLDWEKPGVDAIVENSTNFMSPGSVILMHDGGGERDQDLEALPRILKAWKDAGYRFVTIQELMESDSSIHMDAVKAGPMPADAAWATELA